MIHPDAVGVARRDGRLRALGTRANTLSDPNIESIDRAYATALMELAEEKHQLDEVADEVEQLGELLGGQGALENLLSTPAINVLERSEVINRLFKGRVSDVLYRFLQVVNRKGRLDLLSRIARAFEELVAEKRGLVEVDVHVARGLGPDELDRVTETIGAQLGKRVVLHHYVDRDLIGGLVIRVGDQLFDGSVATRLRSLRRQLITTGREHARQITSIAEEDPR